MKKLFFIMFLIFIVPIGLLAASGESSTLGIEDYVVSFAAYVASVLALTELVCSFIKKEVNRKVVSVVISVLIAVLAFALKLGIFFAAWYIGLVYLVIGILVVTGYLKADKGQMLVDLIIEWLNNINKKKEIKK